MVQEGAEDQGERKGEELLLQRRSDDPVTADQTWRQNKGEPVRTSAKRGPDPTQQKPGEEFKLKQSDDVRQQ